MPFVSHLHKAVSGAHLSAAEAYDAMLAILSGEATTAQIAAFLVALRMKGEQAAELEGFARAMRSRATPVAVAPTGPVLVDTCGTGGDGGRTFNISTVTAFVVAGAGLRVAKHGNRSLSSLCGSADVLEELGVSIGMEPSQAALAIDAVGIGFLFAPAVHPAMRHAQPARAELKMRTAFNLLGPLTNPAGAAVQVIGAPSREAARLMAEALCNLGGTRALVVHGFDGMDEITTVAATHLHEVKDGSVSYREFTPAEAGLPHAELADLAGGDRVENARIARRILEGEPGPRRDIVLLNAAAALLTAGLAAGWKEGVAQAAASIDSGEALSRLSRLTDFCKNVERKVAFSGKL